MDGNKRTGFLLGVLFLELNGWSFAAHQEDAANAVIALAAGEIDEAAYGGLLGAYGSELSPPPSGGGCRRTAGDPDRASNWPICGKER